MEEVSDLALRDLQLRQMPEVSYTTRRRYCILYQVANSLATGIMDDDSPHGSDYDDIFSLCIVGECLGNLEKK